MYINMQWCISVYICICICAYIYICIFMWTYIYVYIYAYIHIYTHIFIHTLKCMYFYTELHTFIYTNVHKHRFCQSKLLSMRIHIHIYIRTCIQNTHYQSMLTYIYIHMHTHMYVQFSNAMKTYVHIQIYDLLSLLSFLLCKENAGIPGVLCCALMRIDKYINHFERICWKQSFSQHINVYRNKNKLTGLSGSSLGLADRVWNTNLQCIVTLECFLHFGFNNLHGIIHLNICIYNFIHILSSSFGRAHS